MKLMVFLTTDEYAALVALALTERRDPANQGAELIRRALLAEARRKRRAARQGHNGAALVERDEAVVA